MHAHVLSTIRPAPASRSRRGLVRLSGAAAAAAAVAVAVYAAVGSPGSGPGVESAAAAVKHATALSAASAERSGTAVVRITHDGKPWAGTTVRWNGDDLSVSSDTPGRDGKVGSKLLVVGRTIYGIEPEHGGWVAQGTEANIDPGSGTLPSEYLAAVREDVGGATLRRMTSGMTGLTTRRLGDGSTVYSGSVAAGLIARKTGFKEGEAVRVLPFGFVANGAAADPVSPLEVGLTVGADGIVREIAVTWGTWSYTVGYQRLGSTPPILAPKNAPSLERLKRERVGR